MKPMEPKRPTRATDPFDPDSGKMNEQAALIVPVKPVDDLRAALLHGMDKPTRFVNAADPFKIW